VKDALIFLVVNKYFQSKLFRLENNIYICSPFLRKIQNSDKP